MAAATFPCPLAVRRFLTHTTRERQLTKAFIDIATSAPVVICNQRRIACSRSSFPTDSLLRAGTSAARRQAAAVGVVLGPSNQKSGLFGGANMAALLVPAAYAVTSLPKGPGPVACSAAKSSDAEGPSSSGERMLSIEEIVAEASAEGSNFVFEEPAAAAADDDDGSATEDPFASRSGGDADVAASSESLASAPAQVLPSPSDVTTVLSAYSSAPSKVENITIQDLKSILEGDAKPLLIDVRSSGEYSSGRVPGAINVPLSEVVSHFADTSLDTDGKQLVVICQAGGRSARAASELVAAFPNLGTVLNVLGGTGSWIAAGFPVEK